MRLDMDNKGFTLIEVLTAIVIVSIIVAGVMPAVTEALRTIYETGRKNQQILESEQEVQTGIARNISYKGTEFPVKFTGDNQEVEVKGSLIGDEDYITFLADKAYIKLNPFALIEGYRPLSSGNDPDKLVIKGYNTNFEDGNTELTILDSEDNEINSNYYNLDNIIENPAGDEDSRAEVEIDDELRNSSSPFTVRLETDVDESMIVEELEIVRARLPVNLPRFLAAGDEGRVIVSAEGDYWVTNNPDMEEDLHTVFWGDNRFLTAGEKGQIGVLADEEEWVITDINLDGNLVLDGKNLIINDGHYYESDDSKIYQSVNSWGSFSISNNSLDWDTIPGTPRFRENEPQMNNQHTLDFSSGIRALNFPLADISGSDDRTVFMVIRPETSARLLLDIFAGAGNGNGRRWTLLRDDDNKLGLEIGGASITTDGVLSDDQIYIISAKLDGDQLSDHEFWINGSSVSNTINNNINVDTAAGRGYLGYQFRDNKQFNGYISEVIIYEEALPENEEDENEPSVEGICNYLLDEFNLSTYGTIRGPQVVNQDNLLVHFRGQELSADYDDDQRVYEWEAVEGENALLANTALNGISCDQDDIFVAVGDGGLIMRKELNNNWNIIPSITSIRLNDVCWSGERFYAVGEVDSGQAVIIRSEDGETWEKVDSGTDNELMAITGYETDYDSVLIAVGGDEDSSQGLILRSVDGQSWTEHDPETLMLTDITHQIRGDQVFFIAVGDADSSSGDNAVILYSDDKGQNWSQYNSGLDTNLNGVGR